MHWGGVCIHIMAEADLCKLSYNQILCGVLSFFVCLLLFVLFGFFVVVLFFFLVILEFL